MTGLAIPAQTGTNGTFTVGTAPTNAEYSRADFRGVAEWNAAHMPYDTTTYTNGEYPSGEDVPVITKGAFGSTRRLRLSRRPSLRPHRRERPRQGRPVLERSICLVRAGARAHFVTAQSRRRWPRDHPALKGAEAP